MRFFTTLESSDVNTIAIGGFDGVHKAHKALISKLGERGVVVAIDRGGKGLTPGEYRCRYIDRDCLLIDLEEVKSKTPKEFMEMIKTLFPNLQRIIVGYDFRFGNGREGSTKSLKELFDGEVEIVDEIKEDGVSIHSRVIKNLLREGKIEEANRLLGRVYQIEGRVIKGQGLGKKALYPTINIDPNGFVLPKEGVYATYTTVQDKRYRSVTFIGKRESTDGAFSVETHIVDDFDGYVGESVRVEFVKFLRKNRKFESISELKRAIAEDIESSKSYLG